MYLNFMAKYNWQTHSACEKWTQCMVTMIYWHTTKTCVLWPKPVKFIIVNSYVNIFDPVLTVKHFNVR